MTKQKKTILRMIRNLNRFSKQSPIRATFYVAYLVKKYGWEEVYGE